jgi:hypothetical protein
MGSGSKRIRSVKLCEIQLAFYITIPTISYNEKEKPWDKIYKPGMAWRKIEQTT